MGACHSTSTSKATASTETTAQAKDANNNKNYASSKQANNSNTAKSASHARKQSAHRYTVVKVLGEGASCRVCTVRQQATGQLYAMKVMEKCESYNAQLFHNEVAILRCLDHPNVLRLIEAYEDKKTYHIITQLCQGGELFDKVKNGSFSEKVAARLTNQLLQALAYCHSHNICHRDLKPENCIFADTSESNPMILVDFGCAKRAADDELIVDVAGSPYYCAPEVLDEHAKRTGAVWKAADMWSVGVMIFLLVCGYPPFNGETQDRIFKKIRRGKFRFPKGEELGGVDLSDSVKNLISELLVMDPRKRFSAVQALQHPWVAGETAKDQPLPAAVVEAIAAFRVKCRLKKAVARVLSNKMTEADKSHLADVFKKFDVNGDGKLSAAEIAAMMKHIGKNNEEGRLMAEAMDEDGDGDVTLQEFQQAAAIGKLNSSAAEVKASFDLFDADKDGFVTHNEIEKLCEFLTPEATAALIKEVDTNKDGRINFEEWLCAMQEMDVKIAKVEAKHINNHRKANQHVNQNQSQSIDSDNSETQSQAKAQLIQVAPSTSTSA